MNQCKLEIFFKFVDIDGQFMGVTVKHNNKGSTLLPTDTSVHCYSTEVDLPVQVDLTFFGKNQDKDTKIDDQGKIIQDKHVLIKEIRLDNIVVEPLYLKRRLKLEHPNGANYSNYIGFNGCMKIELDQPNVFLQVMKMKRLGEY